MNSPLPTAFNTAYICTATCLHAATWKLIGFVINFSNQGSPGKKTLLANRGKPGIYIHEINTLTVGGGIVGIALDGVS